MLRTEDRLVRMIELLGLSSALDAFAGASFGWPASTHPPGADDRRLWRVAIASGRPGSRPFGAVNSPRPRFPVTVSLGGGHLLGDRLFVSVVSDPLEALALELGEPDAVGGVGDVEVKDGPDECEAAGLAGEA